ncbi:putative hscarg dehydrogenase [Microdochium trichocladiopsis]|uniref:Hscarg dehydrogenase n=1 Tax=Microdochium trichocladiopsis TaxID=1682393 RepID=A0A9P9BJS8_9PEZI|nr:putative hscarg dehydrogenase [Microdochium trichocladiopsis]KAH7018453.1 putative hscarg dehydrogenase [Microdochium trichocladiopsis]
MAKLIVVTGATGMQGSGVIDALSANADWKIRGVTRNLSSAKAQALAKRGVEMVAADLDDEDSLTAAFVGASAIFGVTDFYEPFATGIGPEKAMQIEYTRGVNMARAAAKTATLETYFWSTLPAAGQLTKGEVKVPHFDAKGDVDAYLKNNPILNPKTIFLLTGFYASNFDYPPFTPIYSKPAGQYILAVPASSETWVPSLGPVTNIGVTVSGLLQYQYPATASGPQGGRYVHVTTGKYKIQEYFSKWAQIAGKGKLQILSVPLEQFEGLFGIWGTELGLMVKFWEIAGAPRMWGTVGEGDVMIDARDLEGVKGRLVSAEDSWKLVNWDQL